MKRNTASASHSAQLAIRDLGRDLRLARRRRRERQRDVAERMGVSVSTLAALEAGRPGVSIGTLAMAMLALGMLDRLGALADPGDDDIALAIEAESVPLRIHAPRSAGKRRRLAI